MSSNVPKPERRAGSEASGARGALRAGWARLGEITRPGSHRMLLAAAVACLGVLAAGVSIAVFSQPSGGQAQHAAASSPAPAASGAAQPKAQAPAGHASTSTGTKVTSDGITKTALRWPPRLKHRIERWAKGPGGAALAAVTAQLGDSMQAANLKLYPQMRQSCVSLSASVAAARAAPPIPAAAMQRLYARTLTGIDRSAAECRRAVTIKPGDETTKTELNHPLLGRTRDGFAAMSARLYRATAEIRSMLIKGR
jgi:hypothetical protein